MGQRVRLLSLSALLLAACASAPKPRYVECHAWDRKGDIRMLTLEALAPAEFICGERICYGRTQGQQAGVCYYGCPDDWLPAFCEGYK